MAAKGIAGTRIDDVVKRASFTRGAFYSNYSSLQDVLTEAIATRFDTLMANVTDAIEVIEGAPTMDSLAELFDAIRPEARTIHILATEYELHRMRNPDGPGVPGTSRSELTHRISGTVSKVLARMGRRPTVPVESLANIVCLLFMDSIEEDDSSRLRELVDAVTLGLSVPIISADA